VVSGAPAAESAPLLLFLLIVPFWTNSLIRIYGLKLFLSTKGYMNEFLLWLG
jgi:spermidine/putrescine transport system permease protein